MDELLNIRAPHVYLVSIEGDSMQGAGIFDGDLAVVDRSVEPLHGDIVVALLNNDPVCKRLYKQGGESTDDLFAASQPANTSRVMTVLDQINERWGRGTLRAASVPLNPEWGMRRERMSQSFTTKIDALWTALCK